jgi:hypothetical protein
VTCISVDITLWRRHGGQTHVLIEFPGGSGEGNDLTPAQTAELTGNLADLLAQCDLAELQPDEPPSTVRILPLVTVEQASP